MRFSGQSFAIRRPRVYSFHRTGSHYVARGRIPQRKLAAILMADIVGYARLTGIDETGTIAEFKRHLSDYIRPSIRRHDGKLIKTLGDGLLATFDSPVNAVACAVALHEGAAHCNEAIPASRQLRFHVGLNLGDVVVEKADVLGDAVNIAARLESIAEPGATVISDAVAQHVRGKLPVVLEDLGAQQLKNIADPVRVWRVVPSVATQASVERQATRAPSVAVLPFVNMSGDAEQRYFSDGISEDIITELSRFRTLSVVARTSSFVYRDKSVDVKRVAEELNAQFIVEGSVRRLDDRVRITVQLVEGDSRRHVWAEKYDAPLAELFSVQDDVTRRVVGTLVSRVEAAGLETARKRPTGHARAYDCYLKGKSLYWDSHSATDRDEAKRFLEEAIATDPQFARPYSLLAAIENNPTMYRAAGLPIAPHRERALQLAQQAVSLDDSDPLCHLSLAWCFLYQRSFEQAQKHLDTAAQLNPNDSDMAAVRASALVHLGEPEAAIELMRSSIRLNPFHTDQHRVDLAEAYFVARRYEEMISLAEQLSNRAAWFTAWKAAAYAYAGRTEQARDFAKAFASTLREMWAGDPSAGEPEFVEWLLSFSPFKRSSDLEHLVRGLALAGLQTGRAQQSLPATAG